jgi:hypothetical protein
MWLGSNSGAISYCPGRHFVVPGLHRHAQAIELPLGFGHEGEHPRRDGAEVVVLQLLPFGRLRAEERALAGQQVGPLIEELTVHQEVFLLRPHRGDDSGDSLVGAEHFENPKRLLGERLDERSSGILVSSASPVQRDEAVGMQRVTLLSPRMRKAGLVASQAVYPRASKVARSPPEGSWRRRAPLHQLGAGEVEDHSAVPSGRQRVVLLGGEPVSGWNQWV